MVTVFSETMTKDKVVASPKDEILSGVIVNISKGLLGDFVDPVVHSKFDNLDQMHLLIEYEVSFNGKQLKGTDRFAYYEEPMTNSKLGKFLTKYEELKVGKTVKIVYDGNGFGKIKLD